MSNSQLSVEQQISSIWDLGGLTWQELPRRVWGGINKNDLPKITLLGAHCGNPEYEWAAEIARWNPNVFFDLSGSTLTKMHGRLAEFQKIFWWSATEWHSAEWSVRTPNDDRNAFIKIVFGSDTDLNEVESVVNQYSAMFDACDVPERTRKMIMGGTLSKMLGLPD